MGLRLTGSAGLRAAGTDALTVLDEGVAVGGAPGDDKRIFDFVGAGITATPDPNDPTRVEISVTAAVLGGGAPTQIDAGDAPVVGVAVTASHSDHQHGVNTGLAADLAAVDAAAAAAGVSAALPRADHKHTATTGIPVTAQGTANAAGISAALSRADHLHAVLGSMIIQGANNVAATATTRFLWPNYHDALAPVVAIQYRIPRAGSLRNLRIRHNVVGAGVTAITYTIRVNGVATLLLVAILPTAADGSNLATTIAVAAGDLIDIQVTKAAIGASPVGITATMEYV